MSYDREIKLFNAITNIRDDLVEHAQDMKFESAGTVLDTQSDTDYDAKGKTPRKTKLRIRWKLLSSAAACILAAGLAGILIWQGVFHIGGKTGGGSANDGGSGHSEGTTFMSYAGPVFPLTLSEAYGSITASRHVSFDFSSQPGDFHTIWGSRVRDSYVLSNHSEHDVTVTALYPFVSSFADMEKFRPSITTGTEAVQPVMHPGGYSGGFTGVAGEDDPNGSINIKETDSWEDYKALLKDGSYLKNALSSFPRLDQKVTVYEFSDFEAPLEQYPPATQAISFTIDSSRTTILTYGFNGSEWHDNGFRRYSYFVPENTSLRKQCKMLIVLGDDIGSYSLQGYKNGACENGNELEGVSCTITHYEAVLADVLDRLISEWLQYDMNEGLPAGVSKEMFIGTAAELLTVYGPLDNTTTERYQDGRLDDIINEAYVLDRVFYLEFPVTLPAGGSITVTADLYKGPSFDFACSGSENTGIQGYDMVTRLGSNLDFESQTAELTNTELIEIVRQNFGFDLSNNVTKVTLNPAVEHYYLEIRVKEKSGQDQ